MTTKDKVLGALRGRTNEYVSGSQIASHLNISRNAVWKAIEQLRADGYKINAVTHKGYRLIALSDQLVPDLISRYLTELGVDGKDIAPIYFFNELPCTIKKAKEYVDSGAVHGTSVIARLVTDHLETDEGFSKAETYNKTPDAEADNIYMSVVIRPDREPAFNAVRFTRMCVVSVHNALQKLLGISCRVREVDNLYHKGRLMCAIFTEGTGEMKSGIKTIKSVILGIGIAGRGLPWNRSQVTAQILKNIIYDKHDYDAIDLAYRELCD